MEEIEKERRDGDDDADDDDDDASSRGRRCEFMALDLSDAELSSRSRKTQKEIQTLGYFSQQRRLNMSAGYEGPKVTKQGYEMHGNELFWPLC